MTTAKFFFVLTSILFFEKAGALLDNLKIIDEYTENLGLTLKSSDLKTLLPEL